MILRQVQFSGSTAVGFYDSWVWAIFVAIGLLMILLELIVGVETGIDLVFVGSAFILGGLLTWPLNSWIPTLIVTSAICVAYVALGRRYVHRLTVARKSKTNVDAIVGRTGIVLQSIARNVDGFAVTSQVDSRAILDTAGAEKLLGKGDMLYMPTKAVKPKRLQGCFVSDAEMERLVYFWATQNKERAAMKLKNAKQSLEQTKHEISFVVTEGRTERIPKSVYDLQMSQLNETLEYKQEQVKQLEAEYQDMDDRAKKLQQAMPLVSLLKTFWSTFKAVTVSSNRGGENDKLDLPINRESMDNLREMTDIFVEGFSIDRDNNISVQLSIPILEGIEADAKRCRQLSIPPSLSKGRGQGDRLLNNLRDQMPCFIFPPSGV